MKNPHCKYALLFIIRKIFRAKNIRLSLKNIRWSTLLLCLSKSAHQYVGICHRHTMKLCIQDVDRNYNFIFTYLKAIQCCEIAHNLLFFIAFCVKSFSFLVLNHYFCRPNRSESTRLNSSHL